MIRKGARHPESSSQTLLHKICGQSFLTEKFLKWPSAAPKEAGGPGHLRASPPTDHNWSGGEGVHKVFALHPPKRPASCFEQLALPSRRPCPWQWGETWQIHTPCPQVNQGTPCAVLEGWGQGRRRLHALPPDLLGSD